MQVYSLFLVWLGSLLIGLSCSFAQSDAASSAETKYWAGIITERPTNNPVDAIFLVPHKEVVDGVANIRYEKHSTAPLRIRRVMVDSPASRAGLQPGDTILAVNQSPVSIHADLVAAIQANADQTATLHVLRDQEELFVDIQPMVRPVDYAERVQADRAAENASLRSSNPQAGDSSAASEVVTLPGNLPGLLALAAQNNATSPEAKTSDASPDAPMEPNGLESSPEVNFDRSTQLLIKKLEQFSYEWQELLDRQKQTLKDLNELL